MSSSLLMKDPNSKNRHQMNRLLHAHFTNRIHLESDWEYLCGLCPSDSQIIDPNFYPLLFLIEIIETLRKNFYHWLLSVTGRIIAIRLFLIKQLQIPFLGQGRYNQVIISYITVFYLPLVFVIVGCCNYRNFQED